MTATFKELTDFFQRIGAVEVEHSGKTYLAHAIGVYNDLKKWGFSEEFARIGMFHSVYGTAFFDRFTLPLEQRDDVRALIGERAEHLAYLNCAMDREHFDAQVVQPAPHTFLDRFTGQETAIPEEDFDDLCVVHLCDWLEQVERSGNWGYRRAAYRALAKRVGGVALASYDRVFAREPAGNTKSSAGVLE